MWPLIRKFFTVESYAIRSIRLLGVALGYAIESGTVGLDALPQWVGVVIMIISPLFSGTDKTKSGIPNGRV